MPRKYPVKLGDKKATMDERHLGKLVVPPDNKPPGWPFEVKGQGMN